MKILTLLKKKKKRKKINEMKENFKKFINDNRNSCKKEVEVDIMKFIPKCFIFYKQISTLLSTFKDKDCFDLYIKNVQKDIENKIKNRKKILYFDEINTSGSLGIVKRIICDNNFREKCKLPNRFIIICACNPYRVLNESNQNLQFGLSLRNNKKRKLVYTVNPLPYSLLNMILYFNDLSEETTIKYIEKMNEKIQFPKMGEKRSLSKEILKLINDLVKDSHFFMIKKGDISSVSLREINRFAIIFNFFFDEYFGYKKMILKKEDLERKSLVLSLYICYFMRLPTADLRKKYLEEIINKNIPTKDFLDICHEERLYITENVLEGQKIKNGYAKNRGLCENLFSEFICILLREPLIICGKPGSSKSLSVRLLLNVMKGEKSNVNFFKQFPEVFPLFYQCSLTSTSENLEKVFEKAQEKVKKNEYKKIVLIIMDEMGIADDSVNNPLKVLHSKLDDISWESNDNKKNKIALICLSNWTLDASKMNRAINEAHEEPDSRYIEDTARGIVRGINCNLDEKSDNIIKAISNAYLYYYNEEQRKNGKEDFHGFRDFYYLIKYIFYNIKDNSFNSNNIINNINDQLIYVIKGIYRNFGGFEDSENIFLQKFDDEKKN